MTGSAFFTYHNSFLDNGRVIALCYFFVTMVKHIYWICSEQDPQLYFAFLKTIWWHFIKVHTIV